MSGEMNGSVLEEAEPLDPNGDYFQPATGGFTGTVEVPGTGVVYSLTEGQLPVPPMEEDEQLIVLACRAEAVESRPALTLRFERAPDTDEEAHIEILVGETLEDPEHAGMIIQHIMDRVVLRRAVLKDAAIRASALETGFAAEEFSAQAGFAKVAEGDVLEFRVTA